MAFWAEHGLPADLSTSRALPPQLKRVSEQCANRNCRPTSTEPIITESHPTLRVRLPRLQALSSHVLYVYYGWS